MIFIKVVVATTVLSLRQQEKHRGVESGESSNEQRAGRWPVAVVKGAGHRTRIKQNRATRVMFT